MKLMPPTTDAGSQSHWRRFITKPSSLSIWRLDRHIEHIIHIHSMSKQLHWSVLQCLIHALCSKKQAQTLITDMMLHAPSIIWANMSSCSMFQVNNIYVVFVQTMGLWVAVCERLAMMTTLPKYYI